MRGRGKGFINRVVCVVKDPCEIGLFSIYDRSTFKMTSVRSLITLEAGES